MAVPRACNWLVHSSSIQITHQICNNWLNSSEICQRGPTVFCLLPQRTFQTPNPLSELWAIPWESLFSSSKTITTTHLKASKINSSKAQLQLMVVGGRGEASHPQDQWTSISQFLNQNLSIFNRYVFHLL